MSPLLLPLAVATSVHKKLNHNEIKILYIFHGLALAYEAFFISF